MPSEGSHPQVPLSPAGSPRRQKRRWLWPSCSKGCCSYHPTSSGTPRREHKDTTLTGRRGRRRWFSLGKLRRSFSVHGATSMVAPEIHVEDREGCGNGDEETATSREIVPAIIVQSVMPTFQQRLFPKSGRERKSKNKTEARRTVPSESTCSEIVPHPCSPGDNLTVPVSSSPIEEGGNNHNARELHECHSSSSFTTMMARTTTHSQSRKRACKSIGKHDSLAGFMILIVMLLMLGMGDRILAIISTSAFFYLASYFRGRPTVDRGGEGNIRSKEKRFVAPVAAEDYESQQYRKKLLMEGILRRDGRR